MKKLILVLIVSFLGIGCAGYRGMPISIIQPYDIKRSCESLEIEVQGIKFQMQSLRGRKSKLAWNITWFVLFPFAMDLRGGEKVEYNALKDRYDYLTKIQQTKCYGESIEEGGEITNGK